MSKFEYKPLLISEIDCGNRLRQSSKTHVEAIADSIEAHGLQNPVAVRKTEKGFQLLAGWNRICAMKLLKGKAVDCKIYSSMSDENAKLFEIDENLIRYDLNPLDRAVFLAERKRIYEEIYPEAKQGGDRKKQNVIFSFSEDTAEKLGLGKRAIERAVRIATKISPELRKRLNDDGYIKEGELYNLTKFAPDEQEKILDLVLDPKKPAVNIKAAASSLSGDGPAPLTDDEKHFNKLMDSYSRASDPVKKQFKDYLETAK
ncbi:MAG: ParB N-terminal domain-containing protein [Emcibacter sp.]|nr:ParB N-terminal domain-containing protein [Emcibacter sp.]